eukprot:TRINITY_DN6326_c0_g1_i8.p1 TRINITY_DN6326_c0_g1~~TRINITY_DN6326_c0_g1_i8.p1  ORF type:complete len:270 (+),score=33.02 TRINITY_DN6326_c0_g1_i8:312-1121(+)
MHSFYYFSLFFFESHITHSHTDHAMYNAADSVSAHRSRPTRDQSLWQRRDREQHPHISNPHNAAARSLKSALRSRSHRSISHDEISQPYNAHYISRFFPSSDDEDENVNENVNELTTDRWASSKEGQTPVKRQPDIHSDAHAASRQWLTGRSGDSLHSNDSRHTTQTPAERHVERIYLRDASVGTESDLLTGPSQLLQPPQGDLAGRVGSNSHERILPSTRDSTIARAQAELWQQRGRHIISMMQSHGEISLHSAASTEARRVNGRDRY